MKKSLCFTCFSLSLLFLISSTAAFAEESAWSWRGRIISVSPNDDSGEVAGFGAGSAVGVDDDVTLEVDFTYMLSRNIGMELILATTNHDINASGMISSAGNLGSTGVLPPTLTAQYHFSPGAKIRPYAGAGINYTLFYDEESTGALDGTTLELKDSFGLAAQAGVDIDISKDWYANVDLKYIQIDTTASVNGADAVDVDINPVVLGVGVGKKF